MCITTYLLYDSTSSTDKAGLQRADVFLMYLISFSLAVDGYDTVGVDGRLQHTENWGHLVIDAHMRLLLYMGGL